MPSVEEKVEEHFKKILDRYKIRHYGKTEVVNQAIADALMAADSKSGGSGKNYPDIKVLLEDGYSRRIPVMIEAKGKKNKLEKLTKTGDIELVSSGKNPYSAVQTYAVNGALHYGNAILDGGAYSEVIIVGINGSSLDADGNVTDPEFKAYYVAEKNTRMPKEIIGFDFIQMKKSNIDKFFRHLDSLLLTEEEKEKIKRDRENSLEKSIKSIHQRIYDTEDIKNLLSTNDKLYFFCGLIMAGLRTEGLNSLEASDLHSNDNTIDNDGSVIIKRAEVFLRRKNSSQAKVAMVLNYLKPVFEKRSLWRPINGESIIKSIYRQVKSEIIPLLEGDVRLDFTGKILNSLNDWVSIENDRLNDVVLTPRFVTNLMAKITRTDMNSFVWDTCTGSSGFLVSAMDLMIADATAKIKDEEALKKKIEDIKSKQLLGIEILGNIYILAVLNMILMGDGSSQIICGDSHREILKVDHSDFPANVYLLNPPYSSESRGLVFVYEALSRMETGYGAVIIQENAGSGQGVKHAKMLLEHNTLLASISLPTDLFIGKASVKTAIFLFQVNRPHEEDDVVTFIDFTEDGYARQNRKKSTQDVNLRNVDHALERYEEVAAICLGKKPKTSYYTEENGKVIKGTITLNGDDWTFQQHRKIDTNVTDDDLKKTVADYLAWQVSAILRGQARS